MSIFRLACNSVKLKLYLGKLFNCHSMQAQTLLVDMESLIRVYSYKVDVTTPHCHQWSNALNSIFFQNTGKSLCICHQFKAFIQSFPLRDPQSKQINCVVLMGYSRAHQ